MNDKAPQSGAGSLYHWRAVSLRLAKTQMSRAIENLARFFTESCRDVDPDGSRENRDGARSTMNGKRGRRLRHVQQRQPDQIQSLFGSSCF